MKRFMLPRGFGGETALTLRGNDFRHLIRVLRMREGDAMEAVSASGARYRLEIESIDCSSCRARLSPARAAGNTPSPRIHLCQCLPKGRKIDLIVRQAAEAGVARITPLVSERTVPLPDNRGAKRERWLRIAREALQQSGNALLPKIDEPLPLSRAVKDLAEGKGIRLFFHQEEIGGVSLHRAIAGMGEKEKQPVILLIGPEGGLSKSETAVLRGAGFLPVFLGDAVLRTETAALYAIAAVKTLLLERDAWKLSDRT
jgi:16S rRNA (uracil1498-N3)-methyltransferase